MHHVYPCSIHAYSSMQYYCIHLCLHMCDVMISMSLNLSISLISSQDHQVLSRFWLDSQSLCKTQSLKTRQEYRIILLHAPYMPMQACLRACIPVSILPYTTTILSYRYPYGCIALQVCCSSIPMPAAPLYALQACCTAWCIDPSLHLFVSMCSLVDLIISTISLISSQHLISPWDHLLISWSESSSQAHDVMCKRATGITTHVQCLYIPCTMVHAYRHATYTVLPYSLIPSSCYGLHEISISSISSSDHLFQTIYSRPRDALPNQHL